MKKNNNYISTSSGNVFADLGFPNPEEKLAKAELARQINNLIDKKCLNQVEAARLLDIDQPEMSLLSRGRLSGFSFERLFRFLNILGHDITIKVSKTRSKNKSNVSVTPVYMKKSPIIKRPFDSANNTAMHARKRGK